MEGRRLMGKRVLKNHRTEWMEHHKLHGCLGQTLPRDKQSCGGDPLERGFGRADMGSIPSSRHPLKDTLAIACSDFALQPR